MLFCCGFYSISLAFILLIPSVSITGNALDTTNETNETDETNAMNAIKGTNYNYTHCVDDGIDVVYINLDFKTERNQHMRKVLTNMKSQTCGSSFNFRRFPAVTPICLIDNQTCPHANGCCNISNVPLLTGMTEESRDAMVQRYERTYHASTAGLLGKIGLLGCWYSHLLVYDQFINSKTAQYLLVLEDDVRIEENFFSSLKSMIKLVNKTKKDWDVIRFSCSRTKDVDKVSPQLSPKLFHANDHPSDKWHYVYGGTHAVFLQKKTAKRLFNELLYRGMNPIDAVLRTWVNSSKVKAKDAPYKVQLKSFCLDTPKIQLTELSKNGSIPHHPRGWWRERERE